MTTVHAEEFTDTAPSATRSPGRVLVTGGASGLGAAVVAAVAGAGGTPVALDLAPGPGTSATWNQVDVTDRVAVEDAVTQAAERLGGLDAVVTAAGIDRCGRLLDVPAQQWEHVVQVNLFGTVNTVRAALPHLLATHGRVVTVASTLALRGVSDATAYCASKFAVLGFSQALTAETAGQVGVTTLIPGGMDTHFFDGRTEQYRPTDNSQLNDPARVAQAVLFALSQPRGCEIRQLFIAHENEPSWP
ncbi:NADP-dependent 3-hydroxy acid dehydrogenase YdfG [Propionibacterium cyclohexanicum]|uniref:NADP-dependent 3-hydroxy acid dehydrogenase YdfG n=1 Tax=Propionibacterium cyclohexanicum TaxID=64702 RepID=A0A1H9SJB1_9ACTN|nr:SDR family oxidoreductase [Propionibacterium cyclohexanicum]SER84329.1 NADP-dependent 3-hydroxy acid dehydrogenase YdfG [Propionibacterium cyclohexanicum]